MDRRSGMLNLATLDATTLSRLGWHILKEIGRRMERGDLVAIEGGAGELTGALLNLSRQQGQVEVGTVVTLARELREVCAPPVREEAPAPNSPDTLDEPPPGYYPLPSHYREAACRSCGARITWTESSPGKKMPLSLGACTSVGGKLYALSHFADCPQGRSWSERGKKEAADART